jgi:hypothetical protein
MKKIEWKQPIECLVDTCPLLEQYKRQESFPECKKIKEMLKRKLDGYKAQDKRWDIYSEHYTIKLDELVDRLLESGMKCHYCQKQMNLCTSRSRDPSQWTLDRINNSQGHNLTNVVVGCLSCNLSRRNIPLDKFLFTKQLRIEKI